MAATASWYFQLCHWPKRVGRAGTHTHTHTQTHYLKSQTLLNQSLKADANQPISLLKMIVKAAVCIGVHWCIPELVLTTAHCVFRLAF